MQTFLTLAEQYWSSLKFEADLLRRRQTNVDRRS